MATLPTDGSGRTAAPETGPLVRVWDPLVRLFHWSLVACFFTAYLIGDPPAVHENAGYIVLGLLGFRLIWGIVGPRYARFASFVKGPATVAGYLKDIAGGKAERFLGHNPAGGAMIIALIFFVALTAGSGWLSVTDRFWGVNWLEDLHEYAANASVVLVAFHVAGVVTASFSHRENLVISMITGNKRR